MLSQGYRISGRYEILKLIGEGGMSNVYLAIDIFLKRQCAVKILRGDLSHDEKFVIRFQREAISASSLSHPNIVELYDVGEDKGRYYIVMELIEGKTLRQLVKERKTLSVYEVVDIAKQLSSALAHAHEKNVIHRDIKPHNIIIGSDGKAKIMDFGIAMISNYTMLTNTNSIIGSVHYLSPEQVSGKGADNRSDIYSLGIVIYEMLTGEVPFMGDSAINIALEHLNNVVPSVKEQNMNVPQSLENIIRKATAKKVSNRYRNSLELYDDLKTCLSPERAGEEIYVEEIEVKSQEDLTATRIIVDDTFEKPTKPTKGSKRNGTRSNASLYGMFFVITVLIALISFFVLVIPRITTSKDVVVPDVVNMDRVTAEFELRNAKFLIDPEIEYVYSDDIEKDKIIRTSPQVGVTRKEGTYIKLYISKGLQEITLLSYIGKDAEITKGTLEAKGLEVVIYTREVDATQGLEAGMVMEQFPNEGAILKKGSQVQLYIPEIVSTYPDFTGKSREVADQFCTDYSLNCHFTEESHPEIPAGVIIKQSRSEGSKVVANAHFTIYISKGKEDSN